MRERTCLEAEFSVRITIAVRLCGKAHLGQKVLSGTGLKIQVREDKLNLPNYLESIDSPVFVAQDIDTFF